MSVFADANITGTFLHFWTHKVHYKLQHSTLENFDDGGLLSGWSFVRVVFSPGLAFLVVFCPVVLCPVVFCLYTFSYIVDDHKHPHGTSVYKANVDFRHNVTVVGHVHS